MGLRENRNKSRLRVLVDTNVFISVINKESNREISKKILSLIEEGEIIGILSTIIISEILVGYYENEDSINATKFLQNINSYYDIINVNQEIAIEAARIRGGNKIRLPDALIIATGIVKHTDYITSYDKEFLKACGDLGITPPNLLDILQT